MANELLSEGQSRFSLSEFEALASNTFSPSALNSDVFTFEPNDALVLASNDVLDDTFAQPPANDTMILLDDPMEFAPDDLPFPSSKESNSMSIDIEAAQSQSARASASSQPSSPSMSEEDSGHASDESSTYDPLSNSNSLAGFDVDVELKVPRAEKRELQARPFAKRSNKSNFYEDMSDEERRLIEREGFRFPERALTKAEEKQLKKLRRKVKNKISAQDSRKRRKEYVTKLESNIKQAAAANTNLKGKVTSLEKQNQSLLDQLREMQAMLQRKIGGKATSAGTALMLLGLCFSMFTSPDSLNNTALPSLDTFGATGASSSGFTARTLKSLPDVSSTEWPLPVRNRDERLDTMDSNNGARHRNDELDAAMAAQLTDLLATLNHPADSENIDLNDNATGFVDDAMDFDLSEPSFDAAQQYSSVASHREAGLVSA